MTSPVLYHQGKFPPKNLDWQSLVPLIGRANAALGGYNSLLSAIPNAAVLLSPLTRQEAVLSSKIEGTQVTIGEVLEVEAGGGESLTESKRHDVVEVSNYRTALQMCAKALADRPLSQHLLREAHAILMQGVRGQDKTPGEYRTDQNWIGPKECAVEQASFVPIAPHHLTAGMDQWIAYMNDTEQLDPLVQLAIVHVEFEALHPFRDGNGRLGRMLIPLFLYQRRLLGSPDFYMSGYLEAHRETYHERLRAVSRDSGWTGWCLFFLEGMVEQAAENTQKANSILDLYEQVKEQVVTLTRSQYAIRAVDFLFQAPTFKGTDFVDMSQIPRPTALRILRQLRKTDLLHTVREGKGRRPGIYSFRELLNIAEGKQVF